MFGKFRIVEAADLDGPALHVPLRPVHQLQPVVHHVIGAEEIATHPDGPGGRGDVQRQHLLNFIHDLKRVAAFPVHLVAEGQDRHVAQAAHLKQLPRLALYALSPVDHHDGGVHGGEGAVGVFAEIGVAGRVHQIEPVIGVFERHGRGGDGDAPLLLHLHEVRPCAAGFALGPNLPGHVDRAAMEQQLFRQRRLAGVGMGNDRKSAATRDFRRQRRGVVGSGGGHGLH